MSWLSISGIDLSAIAATAQDPKADRRDIGEQAPANDGSLRVTRQTRKFDLSFMSKPLAKDDAFAWESLVVGSGNTWSFDASYYSSKGLVAVPSDPADTSIQATTKKFGTDALKIAAAGEQMTTSGAGIGSSWTQSVWWNQNLAGWHHLVQRSDGAKWLDGVRNDSATTPFSVSFGEAIILAATNADYFDDWVVMPCIWPTTWAPLVFANNAAFSPLPYLTCAGDLVPEAATRSMAGTCSVAKIMKANATGASGGLSKATQVLQVDLKGV